MPVSISGKGSASWGSVGGGGGVMRVTTTGSTQAEADVQAGAAAETATVSNTATVSHTPIKRKGSHACTAATSRSSGVQEEGVSNGAASTSAAAVALSFCSRTSARPAAFEAANTRLQVALGGV